MMADPGSMGRMTGSNSTTEMYRTSSSSTTGMYRMSGSNSTADMYGQHFHNSNTVNIVSCDAYQANWFQALYTDSV